MKESEECAIKILEMFLLAECIFHEARGEPVLARTAVAYVVMNRIKDARMRLDDRIYKTVLRDRQFAPFNDVRQGGLGLGESWRRMCHEPQAFHSALNTAQMVACGQVTDPTEEIGGANHFHDDSIKTPTKWETACEGRKMKIGRIWFYKL